MANRNNYVVPIPDNRSRKKRMENWSVQDVMVLIQIWKENIAELRTTKRNQHIYERIANDLTRTGMKRSWREVKTKISNLTADYRKVEKAAAEAGISKLTSSPWKFWDPMHDVLGSLPFVEMSGSSDGGFRDLNDDDESGSLYVEAVLSNQDQEFDPHKSIKQSPASSYTDAEIYNHKSPVDRKYLPPPTAESDYDDYDQDDEVESPQLPSITVTNVINNRHASSSSASPHQSSTTMKQSSLSAANQHTRPHYSQSPPAKRFRHTGSDIGSDMQLDLFRQILEEQRRANAAARQSEREMRRELHEQMELNRRSLQLEERMTRAVESLCQSLTGHGDNDDAEDDVDMLRTFARTSRTCNGGGPFVNGAADWPANH